MVHQMFSVVDSRTTVITDESLGLLSDLSARMRFSLTIATSASRASLMKWFSTLRSQIGLSGDGRPGRVHSNSISSKASSPAVTDTKEKKLTLNLNENDLICISK